MPPLLCLSILMCLLENDGSGADFLRGVDFGLGQRGGGFEGTRLLVAFDGEGGNVGFGERVLELLEERNEGDGTAGALVVGLAAGSLRDLQEIALAAEAAATAAEACVVVVDGVDRNAGALGVGYGCGDVGAVLIGDAGAAVVWVDAVGDHEDDAGFVSELS